jgi:AcrR family transcriptional regulator
VKRVRRRVETAPHPTRVALLDVTKRLIAEYGTDGFTVEMVLSESGISRGSLYHHFEDFPDLVESALVEVNRAYVESSIELTARALAAVTSRDEFMAAINLVTSTLHSEERFKARIDRVRMIALCADSPSFRQKFGEAQAELVDNLTEVIRDAQERGWARADFDPKALATFMSAYTIGVTLNDVSADPISFESWNALVRDVITRFLD